MPAWKSGSSHLLIFSSPEWTFDALAQVAQVAQVEGPSYEQCTCDIGLPCMHFSAEDSRLDHHSFFFPIDLRTVVHRFIQPLSYPPSSPSSSLLPVPRASFLAVVYCACHNTFHRSRQPRSFLCESRHLSCRMSPPHGFLGVNGPPASSASPVKELHYPLHLVHSTTLHICIIIDPSRSLHWLQLPIEWKNDGGTRLAIFNPFLPHHIAIPLPFHIAVTPTLFYTRFTSSPLLVSSLGIPSALRCCCVRLAYSSVAIEQLPATSCVPSRVLHYPSTSCTE